MKPLAAPQSCPAIAEIEVKLCQATGAPNAHVAMRRLCATVVKASNQKEPPFKIKPLLDVLGVAFEYDPSNSGAAEASISLRDDQLILEVPKPNFKGRSGKSRRWRFSLAHEFAHIVLLRTLGARIVELTYQDRQSYRFVESLCDFAASHILLPRPKLTEVLWKDGFSQKTVRNIMTRFDASESAVLRAIHDLLPGGAIFTARSFRRHESEDSEPRVVFCSTIYSSDTSRPWLPRGATLAKHLRLEPKKAIERVTVSLRDAEWNFDGASMPWLFGPSQPDMFKGGDSPIAVDVSDDPGRVIVCAEIGKFDMTLFQERKVK